MLRSTFSPNNAPILAEFLKSFQYMSDNILDHVNRSFS